MAFRSEWGIPDDAFCILFCGKFVPKKRPSDIIAAVRLLHADGRIPKIHLLFVGSGELGGGLRRDCSVAFDAEGGGSQGSIADGPWRPSATFAGFLNQTEISRAYVSADCLVLPSDSGETWGLVVNEAMASGLPCAASRACGCTEDLLSSRWPERAFDLGDHAGLANAIAAIHDGVRSAETGRHQVASHSIQVSLDQVSRLYEAR
jgi:glycosyltransferase involved in cell wall biosynthesis